jgi:uncharacterized protein YdhG (YjbR/CyaY superfamily)
MKKAASVDEYLAEVPEPARSTLEKMRKAILAVAPKGTVEKIAYGMPAYHHGKPLAYIGAFKNHCSYFPASGGVTKLLGKELEKYQTAKGTIQFPLDKPLPAALVKKLIAARLQEIEG